MTPEMRAAEKVWEAINSPSYGFSRWAGRRGPNGDDLRRTLEAVKEAGFKLVQ
jgi:hypothetical protein